ncbi:hypothetical protein [Burkholderia ubonensis]|uniref:hypothetical protein n=1 Tax=Burkholderia ubonensis TaxID=101571 RepID=UPI00075CE4D6|nr:hypothetical protein [Burkholderia ubonensis]KVP17226.1 hypothetical protein WJ84_02795 [Burkholderia ubonensis]KVP39649.1 hypothetical protein WJ87_05555 [Burkholderia ubonensis]
MKKLVFLDLEDTVIDEFSRTGFTRLVNAAAVRDFLAAEAPEAVRLFSFAFWSDHCVERFRLFFEARLNQALRVTLDMQDTFTTEKLFRLCRSKGLVFESDNECMLFHGKDYGFQHYIEMSPGFDDTEVVLVDDAVSTKTIQYPGRNLTIRMVNVNDLLK